MTQTHLLAAAAAFAKPDHPARNAGLVAGALLPDAAIYILFAYTKIAGIPETTLWRELYFAPWFQDWVAMGNSLFLWLALLVVGFLLLRLPSAFRIGLFVFFLALAALLHVALDLPVHHDDAHRHLWPVSDWRFLSPVSYWDPAHHGRVLIWFEAALGVALAIVLWRRFGSATIRAVLAFAAIAYVAVPAYFTWRLGAPS